MSLQRREREIRKPLWVKSHTDTSRASITLFSAHLAALCRKSVMETLQNAGGKKILCEKVFTLAWGSFRLVWMMGTHLLHKLWPEVVWRLSVFIYNGWKQWLIATTYMLADEENKIFFGLIHEIILLFSIGQVLYWQDGNLFCFWGMFWYVP